MRQEYINKLKKISTGLLLITILTGCGKNKPIDNTKVNNKNTPTSYVEKEVTPSNTVPTEKNDTTTPTPTTTNTPTPTTTNTPTPTEVIENTPTPSEAPTNNNKEIELKNAIKSNIDEIKEYFKNGKGSEILATGKEYSIKFIDFIFYGGEINGMTFNSLSDNVKNEIYEYFQELDYFIMEFDKDYKEDFGERYSIIKDFSSKKYNQAKEAIINKIGEDKYNEIMSKKDEYWGIAKDKTKEYGGKVLEYLDKKYQEYKKNENND
ncbi:MAG: hypothetical protein IKE73_03030 [Bacilli bacterium]|nr:hypothetical protein [Bacilli bacterium]